MALMISCIGAKPEAQRLEEELHEQMKEAMLHTKQLEQYLTLSFDSIWELTYESPSKTIYYVFSHERGRLQLRYWSDNWLAKRKITIQQYNKWYYSHAGNAHVLCYWTYAHPFSILTVIPLQYDYAVENKQLQNIFIEPFDDIVGCDVTTEQGEKHVSIRDLEGEHLFYLMEAKPISQEVNNGSLAATFSYQALLADNEEREEKATQNKIYYILCILLFVSIIALGIYGLIRQKGFRNMRLQSKFMYGIMTLFLANAIYIFVVSNIHVRKKNEAQQRNVMLLQTTNVQKALQEIFYWNITLDAYHYKSINTELKDLSYTYKTDIHVYDLYGRLIGTSTPELFQKGLLSERISPEPYFREPTTMIQEEQIGDLRYLATYAPLLNGSELQIGYICLPFFISEDEIIAEADVFISKLLPPTLFMIILSFLFSMLMARVLTQPLSSLVDKMKHFRIGQQSNRLHYKSNDEVGQLVERYNALVDELEISAQQLANSEREGAWRTMARQIAHEINNSLTPLKLTIQQLQRMKKLNDERFDNYFENATKIIIEQIDDLSHIARSFSDFAKLPEVVLTEVDIAEKLNGVIEVFKNNEVEVPVRYIGVKRNVVVLTDDDQISRVFTNLIKNAIQAVENKDDGDVIIMLKQVHDGVEISVSDNGNGIPQELKDKIFRPNFTTKSSGMGLGLPIAKNIVEGSGGTITFETSTSGTTFYVKLFFPHKSQHHIIEVDD